MRRLATYAAFPLLSALFLAGCSGGPAEPPQINFIGIGTGTLATDVNRIHFTQTFQPTDTQLVAVVSFAYVEKGTTVEATWFSPDERVIPLGRTQIVTASGAHIARFSFASKQPWKAAPFEVRIDAISGTDATMKTASGSLPFFIGMKDADIKTYLDEYAIWQQNERKKTEASDAAEQAHK